jgi:oxalate decarboxylase/phosphoglucose isomerase-like protein (cupin superfamily)
MFGSEKNMLEKTGGKYIIAVQEEGDLLFFPPQWGHAGSLSGCMTYICRN